MYEGFDDFWPILEFCLDLVRPKPGTGYMKAAAEGEGEAGVLGRSQKVSEAPQEGNPFVNPYIGNQEVNPS